MGYRENSFDSELSDQIPKGMRVLAVDDDSISLTSLISMLNECHYHVTTTSEASTGLDMVKKLKNKFDIVICNVDMPDMDESKLLELAKLKPLIMMSTNSDTNLLEKGFRVGACSYIHKPVRLEKLKTIWQHVVKREVSHPSDPKTSNIPDKNSGKNKQQKEYVSEKNDPSATKKSSIVWTLELHQKFVEAIDELGGLDKAIPLKILKLMNIEGLTRENVATHLQTYRIYLKRLNNSSVASKETNTVTTSSGLNSSLIDALNLPKFSASGMDYGKACVSWSVELHQKFLQVINQQGGLEFLDKAVPEKILELMDVKNIPRESVDSHLQKYRHFVKARANDSNQQALLDNMVLGYQLVTEFNASAGPSSIPDRWIWPGQVRGGLITQRALPTGWQWSGV